MTTVTAPAAELAAWEAWWSRADTIDREVILQDAGLSRVYADSTWADLRVEVREQLLADVVPGHAIPMLPEKHGFDWPLIYGGILLLVFAGVLMSIEVFRVPAAIALLAFVGVIVLQPPPDRSGGHPHA